MSSQPPSGICEYHVAGALVDGIDDLYRQVSALWQADDSWPLAASLDALNDALFRLSARGPAVVIWDDHEHSRKALGVPATREWLAAKLARPGRFDTDLIARQLDVLEGGSGPTYFDLVVQVFADHADLVRLTLR